MNVTALLAHPDDELAAAGTLAKFVDAGHSVTLIIAFSDRRGAELHKSSDILGVNLIEHVARQSQFVWNQETTVKYDGIVSQTNPDLLISHRINDNNSSHVPLAQIMRTIARKNNVGLWEMDAALPRGIETDAKPNNLLIDIDAQTNRKYDAIMAYRSVIDQYPGLVDAFRHRDLHNGWLLYMESHPHRAEAMRVVKAVWK